MSHARSVPRRLAPSGSSIVRSGLIETPAHGRGDALPALCVASPRVGVQRIEAFMQVGDSPLIAPRRVPDFVPRERHGNARPLIAALFVLVRPLVVEASLLG